MPSRYILHDVLGRGGMGVVYQATDRLNGHRVAYKQVYVPTSQGFDEALEDTTYQLRLALASEFRILASLHHPHIISVEDYGFDSEGQPFYTMAFLENSHAFTENSQHLTTAERNDRLHQLLQALVYLHHRGVLHRDLKPANVLISEDRVRVLDFGLASLKSQAGSPVGSWSYVAPELIHGKSASESSDLYAVGVMAYELFAHRHPFDTDSPFFMEQILEEIPSFDAVMAPPAICDFINRLLAKEPAQRFDSAQAALQRFKEIAHYESREDEETIRDSFLSAARFVGRKDEMRGLSEAMHDTKAGKGSFWLLGGESGVGKTRLINELRTRALVDGATVCIGQTTENTGTPYQLWQRIVARLVLNIEISDLAAGVLKSLVPNLPELLGRTIPDPPALELDKARQRLINTIVDVLSQQPGWTVLILEDLHWAEESLQVIDQLARITNQLPIMIVGTYRNDERPELPSRYPLSNELVLDRFSPEETASLSEAMLGQFGRQKRIQMLLNRESEGNPFFVVEILRALADQAGKLDAIKQMELPDRIFPDRIASIVQRKLAPLTANARLLLSVAGLIGREIDISLLMAVSQRLQTQLNVDSWLSQCSSTAILTSLNGSWQFAHDKIREGILKNMTQEQNEKLHHLLIEEINALYPNDPTQAGRLADLWRALGNRENERHFAIIAGKHAVKQFANEVSLHYLNRAIMLTNNNEHELLHDLLLTRESIHHLLGNRRQQTEDLIQLKNNAKSLREIGKLLPAMEVSLREARLAETSGDYEAAVDAANDAISLAQQEQDLNVLAHARLAIGQSRILQGNFEAANQALEAGLTFAQQGQNKKAEADCNRFLGVASLDQGQVALSTNKFQRALTLYREIDDKQGESSVLSNLGIIKFQENVSEGLNYWKQARNIFEEIGEKAGMARILTNLSTANTDLGEYSSAVSYGEQALRLCQEIDVPIGVCFNLLNLSLTELYRGNNDQALILSKMMLQGIRDIGARRLEAAGLNAQGLIYKKLGQLENAQGSWEAGLAIANELEMHSLEVEIKAELALLALEVGEQPKSRKLLQEVMVSIEKDQIVEAADKPFRLQLVTVRVLNSLDDNRGDALLQRAYNHLQDKAAKISDAELRESFLNTIVENRQISNLYAQRFAA